ncbi:hypothetical protein [Caldicellulosiruptor bescii]|uniref:hypothetical protein n=2 Tax=Caldicellulosiruptor bescii TaxID=31899 RepID=UPI000184797C|nr:hypothetical protein [Caldicellulosiruptor bescii]
MFLSIFVVITIIAMGMFLIFKDDLFVFRNNKPIYTKGEPVLVELKFGSTKGELIKKLGNPKKVKKEWWVLMVIMENIVTMIGETFG